MFKRLNILFVLICSGLTIASAIGYGQNSSPAGNLYTLYPPLNFQCTQVECNLYLHWDKPQMPDGTTPPGLVGYNLYCDGSFIHYHPHPDSTSYFAYWLDPYMLYTFTLTAKYDLTPYGIPGQFGESTPAGPITCGINCISLPLHENWDSGTFTFNNWQFIPAQYNWEIDVTQGNPWPAAVFTGLPALQNYSATLKSTTFNAIPWACGEIALEFDYKLVDISAGGTEKLIVMYYIDNTWHPVAEFKNEGSTGWVHQKIDIPQVIGKIYRIGFKVEGLISSNLSGWYIDNIILQPVCKGPTDCGLDPLPHGARLYWQPPDCDSLQNVAGYNIYRTDATGNDPFIKLNPTPVTAQEYFDLYPPALTSWHFRYFITVLQKNWQTGDLLCEKPCDTLDYIYTVGLHDVDKQVIRLYPQPADEFLDITAAEPIESWEIRSVTGIKLSEAAVAGKDLINIPLTGIPSGIYLVVVHYRSGSVLVSKMVVAH